MNNPQEGSIHVMNKRYDTLHILQVLRMELRTEFVLQRETGQTYTNQR